MTQGKLPAEILKERGISKYEGLRVGYWGDVVYTNVKIIRPT
jgi:hypothetical protein